MSLSLTGMNTYFVVDLIMKANVHIYADSQRNNPVLDFCVSYQGLIFFFQSVVINSLDTWLSVVPSKL